MGGLKASVAVIGAGVAGCAAAAELAESGASVWLFDKGRLIGGRLAAKRMATPGGMAMGAIGAQYASADGAEFGERLAALEAAGLAAPWSPRGLDAGKRRLIGVPDMRALVGDAPARAAVRVATRVERLDLDAEGWRVSGDGFAEGPFAGLVVSAPAPQTADLLEGPAPKLADRARQARLAPCWAALLWFETRVAAGFDAAAPDHPVIAWLARETSRQQASSPGDLWVVQAGPGWSGANLEIDEAEAAEALAGAFAEAVAAGIRPGATRAHRWRYALVQQPLGTPTLVDPSRRLATAGDWHLGPGIEAAWTSGRAAGRALLEALA